jgi:amino acid adenylation domain-containing protein
MSLTNKLAQLSLQDLKLLSKKINRQQGAAAMAHLPIRHTERQSTPLSFGQERLWFLDQLVPGNPAYNWPIAIRCTVPLDLQFYTRTLEEMLRRHQVLRASFPMVNGAPVQMVAPVETPYVQVTDLSALPVAEREATMQRLVREDARKAFDLARGPLYRFHVLVLGPEEWISAWTIHHAIIDGWSRKVMLDDLGALGAALADGSAPRLPPLAIQYGDYAAWQREWYQGDEAKKLVAYWRARLEGVPNLELPTDRPRPAFPRFNGSSVQLRVSAALTEQLRALSQQAGSTLFMTMLAAFQATLHRHTGQTDIAVAIPVANRNRSELENLIGFFVNTLVIRTDLSGNPGFRALLGQVRQHCVDAYAHQEMPFEKLVEELRPAREVNRNPLAQVMFQLENIPKSNPTRAQAGQPSMQPLEMDSGTAIFDMSVHLYEPWDGELLVREDGLTGVLTYNSDIFDDATIARFVQHLMLVLEHAATEPETPVRDIPILTVHEQQDMLTWNRTAAPFDETACIGQRVQEQARRTPQAIAIVHGSVTVSYAELNAGSNRLAYFLRSLGVRADERVVLCVERSIEMVVGMLAILKAGGAYVPMDPSYPAARIAAMVHDSAPRAVLTQARFGALFGAANLPIIDLEDDGPWRVMDSGDPNPAEAGLDAGKLAYLIYTSGSTGAPKAVMIEHRSLHNHVQWFVTEFGFAPTEQFLIMTSHCFDMTQKNIWGPLFIGATVHLADEPFDPPHILALIKQAGIKIINLTPTAFHALIDANAGGDLAGLERVILGGETIRVSKLLALPEPRPDFFNFYGPTECTLMVLFHKLHRDLDFYTENPVPLGRPITNAHIYVLDADGRRQPVGVAGEIHIGGVPVGRGYLNQPALTALRFVADPFVGVPGARMYKTGDVGRWRADGTVEFLGRNDTQVKVRGFRIELGEIESAIESHPLVNTAAVLVGKDDDGNERLMAFVTPDQERLASDSGAEQAQRVADWRQLHESLFSEIDADTDGTFATIGWNSSYTAQPIPDDEMRESIDGIVARVLEGAPRRVLELGCGSGMLVFRMVGQVDYYMGTDISQAAIDHVGTQAATDGIGNLQLRCQPADCFDGVDPHSFDVVFLNSVAQYFPHLDYLRNVIEGALGAVKPGGRIVIGDLRHGELLRLFHLSVELSQASSTMPLETLERRVARRVTQEEELLVSPAFFGYLQQQLPAIGAVEVQLKRGRFLNELTKFRYDVSLHVGRAPVPLSLVWHDWRQEALGLDQIDSMLSRAPSALGLTGVPNARLAADAKSLEIMNGFHRPERVLDLRRWEEMAATGASALEPEALWELAERHGYQAQVNWHAARPGALLDIAFVRGGQSGASIAWPDQDGGADCVPAAWSNNPLYAEQCKRLAGTLRQDLAARLPEHMLPPAWAVLAQIPLTTNGKLNRAALVQHNDHAIVAAQAYMAPRDPFELAVAQMWEEILGVKPVGARDNFFALGGHSLLAVRLIARFRREFSRDLPLSVLFEHQTVEELASILRSASHLYEQRPLVQLHGGGAEQPIFLVHPAGGGVMGYMALAEHMGPTRAVFGLQYAGLPLSQEVTGIEAMAAHYVAAMRERQPEGPYLVGGWSTGGVIAFEAARQLAAAGQHVPRVVIIDVPAPLAGAASAERSTASALVSFARKTSLYSGRELSVTHAQLDGLAHEEQLELFFNEMKKNALVPSDVGVENFSRFLHIYENNIRALPGYQAGTYAGDIILLRGEEVLPEIAQELPATFAEPALRWNALCEGRVVVHTVPGNHITMITPPHVTTLVRVLNRALAEQG